MRARPGRVPLLLAALAPASLVLTHDLSFLASYGSAYRTALLATGHDGRWTETVTIVLLVSGLLALIAFTRLLALWSQARSLGPSSRRSAAPSPGALLGSLVRLWPWLVAITAILFVGQENLERLAQGEPLPGLTVLTSGSLIQPIEVLALVSLLLSAVAALFLWTHASLVARIRSATRERRRHGTSPAARPAAGFERPHRQPIAAHLGRRAPPEHVLAT